MGIVLDDVMAELDQIEINIYNTTSWRTKGCTSRMIFRYAQGHDRGACCLHGAKLVETSPGSKPLCWAIHEGHAYFYVDTQVCKKLAALTPAQTSKHPKMHCIPKTSDDPTFEDWSLWPGVDLWLCLYGK